MCKITLVLLDPQYTRVEASFKPNKMSLEIIELFVHQITQFVIRLFSLTIMIKS